MEVWPPSSPDFNLLDFFLCGVSRRDINRSSYNKKQSLITSMKKAFSNIPREAVERGCSQFKLRLGDAVGAKGDLNRKCKVYIQTNNY